MNYRYIKALGLSNDNISLAYDIIMKKDVWSRWKAIKLLFNTLQMGLFWFWFWMLVLIVGTEIPSTLIRSTTAKIVRIVKMLTS